MYPKATTTTAPCALFRVAFVRTAIGTTVGEMQQQCGDGTTTRLDGPSFRRGGLELDGSRSRRWFARGGIGIVLSVGTLFTAGTIMVWSLAAMDDHETTTNVVPRSNAAASAATDGMGIFNAWLDFDSCHHQKNIIARYNKKTSAWPSTNKAGQSSTR